MLRNTAMSEQLVDSPPVRNATAEVGRPRISASRHFKFDRPGDNRILCGCGFVNRVRRLRQLAAASLLLGLVVGLFVTVAERTAPGLLLPAVTAATIAGFAIHTICGRTLTSLAAASHCNRCVETG